MTSKAMRLIRSLRDKKYRLEEGLFIVEGIKMISELLTHQTLSSFIDRVFATKACLQQTASANLLKYLYKTKLEIIPEQNLQQISKQTHASGVLALVKLEAIAANKAPAQKAYWKENWSLLLDDIQDPGNMGTIIRLADWFGIRHIICSEQSVDYSNPKVVQASMGSLFRVGLHRQNLQDFIKDTNPLVYGAVLDGESIYETDFSQKGAILFGNESQGISKALQTQIDKHISIPCFGAAESLNVSTAAAIFCAEISRTNTPKYKDNRPFTPIKPK